MKKITVNYAHFWQVLGLEISVTSVYCHGYFKACFGSMKASSRCGTFFGMLIEEGVYKTWSWNFLNQCSLANKTLVLVPWKLREEADILGNVYRRGGGGDWKTAAKLGMGWSTSPRYSRLFVIPSWTTKGTRAIGVKYLIKGFPCQKAECLSSVLISFRWLNQQITGLIVDKAIKDSLNT